MEIRKAMHRENPQPEAQSAIEETPRPKTIKGMLRFGAESLFRMRRRIATGVAITAAIFFGYHAVFGGNGLNAYQQKRQEDHMLQKQILDMQQENARLQQHVQQLKNDPDAIEHEARERLHYARPGEVIWTLDDKPAASAQKKK